MLCTPRSKRDIVIVWTLVLTSKRADSHKFTDRRLSVTFTLQSGPIKEFGVNSCQIDDVVEWAKAKIEEFQKAFPCSENALVVTKLDEALIVADEEEAR